MRLISFLFLAVALAVLGADTGLAQQKKATCPCIEVSGKCDCEVCDCGFAVPRMRRGRPGRRSP